MNKPRHHYDVFGSFNDQGDMPQVSGPVKAKSKITPRVREQAAIYCSAVANFWAGWVSGSIEGHPFYPVRYVRDSNASDLARKAFNRTAGSHKDAEAWSAEHTRRWAEAEALLRTGWEP
jgi:hypothetical protein